MQLLNSTKILRSKKLCYEYNIIKRLDVKALQKYRVRAESLRVQLHYRPDRAIKSQPKLYLRVKGEALGRQIIIAMNAAVHLFIIYDLFLQLFIYIATYMHVIMMTFLIENTKF